MDKRLLELYKKAKNELINSSYKDEIDFIQKINFNEQTEDDFFREYIYVICNSGMKNQVAEKIFSDYMENGIVAIKHPLKMKAILEAEDHYKEWFKTLKIRVDHNSELEFLESLPHIGKITKYHLARNLGIDVAKPDRHMMRIARSFGYEDPMHMCIDIHSVDNEFRIGTIDVILWRYCNLHGIKSITKLHKDLIGLNK